ncbi:Cytochrome b6-f complex iron-sulfur subunit [Symmachiella dynata]|uniref:QcrA and Rieske domain-containing protein n=1 Tax=Symmachiella dynata TaxID=2527995 RepID=UPI00118BA547|nr:Rieske 2Fe-2S domain-containing protein [Symmachiella dynata]QDT51569.1 Cytochrome b6-f complex iron-sulfur subunit [Symmachiella dynata]
MNSQSGEPPTMETATTRRGFMEWFSWALLGLGSVAMAIPILGFFLGPILKPRADEWVDFGPLADFPQNSTRLVDVLNPLRGANDGMTGKVAAYVRRIEGETFQIFSTHCTHLGCPVSWFKESGLYMCPCHGGVYYEDGGHASGPPPRGLYEFEHRVEKDRLMVKLGHLPTLQDPGSAHVSGKNS